MKKREVAPRSFQDGSQSFGSVGCHPLPEMKVWSGKGPASLLGQSFVISLLNTEIQGCSWAVNETLEFSARPNTYKLLPHWAALTFQLLWEEKAVAEISLSAIQLFVHVQKRFQNISICALFYTLSNQRNSQQSRSTVASCTVRRHSSCSVRFLKSIHSNKLLVTTIAQWFWGILSFWKADNKHIQQQYLYCLHGTEHMTEVNCVATYS